MSETETSQESETACGTTVSGSETVVVESSDVGDDKEVRAPKPRSKPTEEFVAFLAETEALPDSEARVKATLQFMEKALCREQGVPHFKNFWDARDLCLKLFKETIGHQARELFWEQYSELSREARRLKEVLDEQSAFAVEQIEMAIHSLEAEVEGLQALAEKGEPLTMAAPAQFFKGDLAAYGRVQKELNLLNAYAARVNAMRKELIKTDMRVRHKNKFFQRLSAAGDRIFPRRKELIASISETFTNDVDKFISDTFKGGMPSEPAYQIRDEIKALQAVAKVLTLNTHAFTTTRLKLSEAWDKVKEVAKERKKQRLELQSETRENSDGVKVKIDEVAAQFVAGELTPRDTLQKLDAIHNGMRDVKLSRDDVRFLKDELKKARTPVDEKIKADSDAHLAEQQKKRDDYRARIDQTKEDIRSFVESSRSIALDDLIEQRKEKVKLVNEFQRSDKRELELLLKPLEDIIQDKKEQALLNLSVDDQKALHQLREVLEQRIARRAEIKNRLEALRKEAGASGLGFEQAMAYNEEMATERDRLEKINQGISEIEEKLEELENKAL